MKLAVRKLGVVVFEQACHLQNQHLEAQVELLEADLAGRHNADSRPGSPRDTVESLQADNARLQHQVHISLWFTLFTLVNVVFIKPPAGVVSEMLTGHIVLATLESTVSSASWRS